MRVIFLPTMDVPSSSTDVFSAQEYIHIPIPNLSYGIHIPFPRLPNEEVSYIAMMMMNCGENSETRPVGETCGFPGYRHLIVASSGAGPAERSTRVN